MVQQQSSNGGSLERRTARIKANGIDPTAFSDSEYAKYAPGQVQIKISNLANKSIFYQLSCLALIM